MQAHTENIVGVPYCAMNTNVANAAVAVRLLRAIEGFEVGLLSATSRLNKLRAALCSTGNE